MLCLLCVPCRSATQSMKVREKAQTCFISYKVSRRLRVALKGVGGFGTREATAALNSEVVPGCALVCGTDQGRSSALLSLTLSLSVLPCLRLSAL